MTISRGPVQLTITIEGNAATILIPGSGSIHETLWKNDWLFNAAAIRIAGAHAGYSAAAAMVWRDVRRAVEGCTTVLIRGHSFGAAVGGILAMMLGRAGFVVHWRGYGCPGFLTPCAARMFRHMVRGATYRNSWDIVPYGFAPLGLVVPGSKVTTQKPRCPFYLYRFIEDHVYYDWG